MDSPQSPTSTLDSLRTVEFRLGIKGYNVDEVDEYLEKAALEAEALQEQVRQLNERLRQASDRIVQLETERREAPVEAPAPVAMAEPAEPMVADETLQRTLLLAQKFVDQTKRESEAEAEAVVARAEEQARGTVERAEEQARKLSTEAEQRLRDEVSRLESARGQLATDVENMARHLESERNRLRTALSDVLKWVDENVQPANSLMALRPKSASPAPSAAEPAPRPSPRPSAADPASGGDNTQVLDLRGAPGGPGAPGAPSGGTASTRP